MFLGLFLGLGQVNQALGAPSPNRSTNVPGVASTGTSGSITFITTSITGVGATASIGSVTVTSTDRHANVIGVGASGSAGSVATVSDAAQTTAFLARTSGLSGTETAAYKALINGLVTDGTFALLDALYIFATNTTATANLNLISTSFGLTKTGTVTFTADQGYTGDGSTGFFDTGYTVGSGVYSQNSASIGVYLRGGRTTPSASAVVIGSASSSSFAYISPLNSSSAANLDLNGFSFVNVPLPSNIADGFISLSRTISSSIDTYKNASATTLFTAGDVSSTPSSFSFYIGAYNSSGTPTGFSTDQISAAYIGSGITGAQHLLLSNRINAYMTALGVNVY